MCVHHGSSDSPSQTVTGQNRRGFLRTAALAGAGAAALGTAGATPALASDAPRLSVPTGGTGKWNPNPNSRQFTLAVMPDTQFLYWGTQNSVNSAAAGGVLPLHHQQQRG